MITIDQYCEIIYDANVLARRRKTVLTNNAKRGRSFDNSNDENIYTVSRAVVRYAEKV
jgi:hypothetical protein